MICVGTSSSGAPPKVKGGVPPKKTAAAPPKKAGTAPPPKKAGGTAPPPKKAGAAPPAKKSAAVPAAKKGAVKGVVKLMDPVAIAKASKAKVAAKNGAPQKRKLKVYKRRQFIRPKTKTMKKNPKYIRRSVTKRKSLDRYDIRIPPYCCEISSFLASLILLVGSG